MFNYDLKKCEVRELPELLKDYLRPSSKIIRVEYKTLPQNGYGSVMIKTTITIKTENEEEKIINAVAKVLPPDPVVREMFQIEKTYMNELNFYKICLPALNEFRKEKGVLEALKIAPRFLGGRLTLGESDEKIDEDAVIVLEDLAVLGFANGNRRNGFDLEGAKLILRDLAKLHGTSIALRRSKPDVFQKVFKDMYEEFIFPDKADEFDINLVLKSILMEDEKCKPLAEKKSIIWKLNCLPEYHEDPFCAITHNDCWVNNTMQRVVNGNIVDNKIVDYQVVSYRSCAHDVFFFLWTSIQQHVLERNIDNLLHYYHENLLETVQELGCDTNYLAYEEFLISMQQAAKFELGHASFFVLMVKFPEIFMGNDPSQKPTVKELAAKVPQDIKELYWFMYPECAKRQWGF